MLDGEFGKQPIGGPFHNECESVDLISEQAQDAMTNQLWEKFRTAHLKLLKDRFLPLNWKEIHHQVEKYRLHNPSQFADVG